MLHVASCCHGGMKQKCYTLTFEKNNIVINSELFQDRCKNNDHNHK